MTDIFISYSRRDIAFARLLYQALKDNQLDIWIDWERIPVGENWWNEITGAIEGADVFMFIMSRNSLGSEVCKKEISHALNNHKRVIPVILDDLKAAEVTEFMPELGRINWMIFQREQVFHLEESGEEDSAVAFAKQPLFEQSLVKLSQTVRVDWDWLRQHTRLQVRALEWERHERNASYLLRGVDLEEAEAWLAKAGGKEQQPTTLQAQYLSTSRAEETLRQKESIRRQRITLGAILVGLAVAIILGMVAWGQRNQYLDETHVRATAESNAVSESHTRATAEANAVSKEQARATAESNAVSKEKARATAQAQAENQTRLALSGKLAANALTVQSSQFDLSMLLAVRSYDTAANAQSLQGMFTALDYSPRLSHILPAQGLTGDSLLVYGGKTTMALSPDGKILAVLICNALDINAMFCASREVLLWNTATWQRIGSSLRGAAGESPFDVITFSRQGNELVLVAVAIRPLSVTIWRVSDQAHLSSFIAKKSEIDQPIAEAVFSLAFSPDGQRIAASMCSSYSGNPIESCGRADIRLVDWTTQKELAHWNVTSIAEILKSTSVPQALAFSPDGAFLAYPVYPGKIVIRDIATGEPVGKSLSFGSGFDAPSALAFSPDGKTLAASGCGLAGSGTTYCLEGVIYFYDLAKGTVSGSALRGHTDSTTLLQYSLDGKKLVSGSYDRTLWLWDPIGRQPLSGVMRGHNKRLSSLAVSADGLRVYSLDSSGQVIAWDIGEAASLVRPLEGGATTRPETLVAASPDGKLAAASNGLGQLLVWDAQTGKQVVQPFKTQDSYLKALAFSADGKSLFTSGRARPLERWDLSAGATNPTSLLVNVGDSTYAHTIAGGRLFVNTLSSLEKTVTFTDVTSGLPVGKPAPTSSLPGGVYASTPDATLLTIGGCVLPGKTGKDCTQGEIQLVHLPDWTPVGEPLRGHAAAVRSLALSADGKTLISSAEGGSVLVWTVGSPAEPRAIDISPSGLKSEKYWNPVFISPDGRLLAVSAFNSNETAFFETASGKYLGKTSDLGGYSTFSTTAFSPDDRIYAIASGGGVFYLVTGVSTRQPVTQTIKDQGGTIMAFSPDGKTFAGAGTSVSLWAVDGETLTKGKTLSGYGRDIHGMAFSADGKTLGVLYDDSTLELWDPAAGTLLARPYFGALYNPVASVFNGSATLLAGAVCVRRKSSVCLESEIHFWDTVTGKESGQPILAAAATKINALAFSRDGRYLASADCLTDLTGLNATNLCTQEEVRLWDVAGRKSFGPALAGLVYDIVNLAFSSDGSLLAGTDLKQVVLWETASGTQRAAPTPFQGARGLTFHPDGSLLVVGMDNGISLVDPQSGRILGQSTQANAREVAFNPAGTTLFSRTAAWQFDPSVWRARLCSQAGRDLTQSEWSAYLPGLPYQKTCVP